MRTAKPHRDGLYWLYAKGNPNRRKLRYIGRGPVESDPRIFVLKYGDVVTASSEVWSFEAQYTESVEWIGETLPPRLQPKRDGYYWVTSADGYRAVVKMQQFDAGQAWASWRGYMMGRSCQYGLAAIIEAYKAVRFDFIDEADEDYSEVP